MKFMKYMCCADLCLCSCVLNNRCRKHGTQIKKSFVALVPDIYVMYNLSLLCVPQTLAMTETLLVITALLGGDSVIRWHAVEKVLKCTAVSKLLA